MTGDGPSDDPEFLRPVDDRPGAVIQVPDRVAGEHRRAQPCLSLRHGRVVNGMIEDAVPMAVPRKVRGFFRLVAHHGNDRRLRQSQVEAGDELPRRKRRGTFGPSELSEARGK